MNKTRTIILVIVIVILAALGIWYGVFVLKPKEPIKIGFVGPFTGGSAAFGNMMQNGLDLAMSELSDEQKSRIEIIKEDDMCKGEPGLTSANKLINVDEVKYIIGPLCNESSLASEKVFEDNKVISLTIGLPSNDIANMGPYHFSFSPEIEYLMKTISDEMISNGFKKAAVIHVDAPFQNENYKQFVKHYKELGGEIVADESAVAGAMDFRTSILKMKSANPDSLMLIAHTGDLNNILKQLKEQGIDKLPKYGIHAAETPVLLQGAADIAEGLVYPYPADRNEVASAKSYYDRYKEKYNFDADPYSSNVYDSFKILLTAIDKCGYDNVSCVQEEFASLQNYNGANGILSVDDRGVGTYKSIMLKTVKSGKFEKVAR
ncbi:MAG: penicillin-binding protein activator [Candidatus Pacebacteria bacterium]|nr:penicillin-binding protein activator [Candidatus Paceibacterota bacterium]